MSSKHFIRPFVILAMPAPPGCKTAPEASTSGSPIMLDDAAATSQPSKMVMNEVPDFPTTLYASWAPYKPGTFITLHRVFEGNTLTTGPHAGESRRGDQNQAKRMKSLRAGRNGGEILHHA